VVRTEDTEIKTGFNNFRM